MKLIHKYQNIFGVLLILAVLVSIVTGSYFRGRPSPEFVEYAVFIDAVYDGEVESVRLGTGPEISFYLTGDATTYITNNPRRDDFKEFLLLQGVAVTETASSGEGFLQLGFTVVLLAGVIYVLHRRTAGVHAKSGFNATAVNLENAQTCNFNNISAVYHK